MMKKGTICIITGLLLIVAAIGFISYNLWDNHRAGIEAHDVLDQLLPEIKNDPLPEAGKMLYLNTEERQQCEDEIEYPDYILNPGMDMPEIEIEGVSYIGTLSIPSIELELPISKDWDYDRLKNSPCRYAGSVYQDNMIICAHNYDIYFGQLKNLEYGAKVSFTDLDGNVFVYKVIEIEILRPTAIDEMKTGDWDLTLFTCTIGGATRVTLRCDRV